MGKKSVGVFFHVWKFTGMVSRYVHPWPELFEGDLSALMDELGFDTLASPTHSPVIDPETSSQLFFVSSMEFGMIIN